jgi:hypothetical protein
VKFEKREDCPRCGAVLDQPGYDLQFHAPCGWATFGRPPALPPERKDAR